MIEVYTLLYKEKEIGCIEYDLKEDKFRAYLTVKPSENEFPILLFSTEGLKEVGDRRVRNYLKSISIPKTRENIEDVLKGLGVKHYNQWEIYKAVHGKNANDYATIEFKEFIER